MFLCDEMDEWIEVREINPGLTLRIFVPAKLKTAKTP